MELLLLDYYENKKILVIINPTSGKKKHKQDIIFVENFFNKHSIKIVKFLLSIKVMQMNI